MSTPCRPQQSKPLGSNSLDTLLGTNNSEDDNPLGAPFTESLDGGGAGSASSDDGVDEDGKAASVARRSLVIGDLLGKVVVILDGVQRRGFAVHAEVMNRDRYGEDGLHSWRRVSSAHGEVEG